MYLLYLFRLSGRITVFSIKKSKKDELKLSQILFSLDINWLRLYSPKKYSIQRFKTLEFAYSLGWTYKDS